MKYVNYHPEEFSKPVLTFMLALASLLFSFCFEAINLFILFSKDSVYNTIVSYVTVDVLKGFGSFYFSSMESDTTNLLREVLCP